ncbi:MAG TPA: hypothetical protein VIK91_12855 [Nannocystis sp.]
MGITINFRGRLRDPSLIPEVIEVATEKAKTSGWILKTMEEMIAEGRVTARGLRGVSLWPHPKSEPLRLHFDDEGYFTNHSYYAYLTDPKQAARFFAMLAAWPQARMIAGHAAAVTGAGESPIELFRQGSRHVWIKTQHAGPAVHAAVCAFLREIKERYAPELEIRDDTGFFESGDYAKLEADFAAINVLIDRTREAFKTAAAEGPKTVEALIERARQVLQEPGPTPN